MLGKYDVYCTRLNITDDVNEWRKELAEAMVKKDLGDLEHSKAQQR